jgi:hypothetical protein
VVDTLEQDVFTNPPQLLSIILLSQRSRQHGHLVCRSHISLFCIISILFYLVR